MTGGGRTLPLQGPGSSGSEQPGFKSRQASALLMPKPHATASSRMWCVEGWQPRNKVSEVPQKYGHRGLPCTWSRLAFPGRQGWRGLLEPQATVAGGGKTLSPSCGRASAGSARPRSHREDTGSRRRPVAVPLLLPPCPVRFLRRPLAKDALQVGFVLKPVRENNVRAGDLAGRGSRPAGGSQGRAAFLGNKGGPTAHSTPARTFHSIVLPRKEPPGNESGHAKGCLTLATVTQPCRWTPGGGGTHTRLRTRRTGALAQAGGSR